MKRCTLGRREINRTRLHGERLGCREQRARARIAAAADAAAAAAAAVVSSVVALAALPPRRGARAVGARELAARGGRDEQIGPRRGRARGRGASGVVAVVGAVVGGVGVAVVRAETSLCFYAACPLQI